MDLRLTSGRVPTRAEVDAGEAVAVVSYGLASAVAGSVDRLPPDTMRLGTATWRIVGVMAPAGLGPESLVAYVPYTAADAAMAASPVARVAELRVRAAEVEDVRAVRDRVRAWVEGRDPAWAEATTVVATGTERLQQMEQAVMVFKMLMGAITAISLLVGGVGIMNVLLASIADRTREIGLRKAMGASRRVVLLQFLAESVAIAGSGSVVGVAAGIAGAYGVTALVRARTAAVIYAGFSWQSLAVSAGVALAVGLVFGIYPALRAARLSPIDALRYE